jgi:hypothetical protein
VQALELLGAAPAPLLYKLYSCDASGGLLRASLARGGRVWRKVAAAAGLGGLRAAEARLCLAGLGGGLFSLAAAMLPRASLATGGVLTTMAAAGLGGLRAGGAAVLLEGSLAWRGAGEGVVRLAGLGGGLVSLPVVPLLRAGLATGGVVLLTTLAAAGLGGLLAGGAAVLLEGSLAWRGAGRGLLRLAGLGGGLVSLPVVPLLRASLVWLTALAAGLVPVMP